MEDSKQESGYTWLSKNLQIMTIRRINIDYLEWDYRKDKESKKKESKESQSEGTSRPSLMELAKHVIQTYNEENSGTDSSATCGNAIKSEKQSEDCKEVSQEPTNHVTEMHSAERSGTYSSAASGIAIKSENKTEGCNEANEEFTNAVIETDNAEGSGTESPPAPENSNESENGTEDHNEVKIPVGTMFKPISFSDDWLNEVKGNTGFSILAFYCEVTINRAIDSLLEEAGAVISKPLEISHIFVFFKDSSNPRCMYTLTTGMRGYVPFQRFSDYHFPRKIAVRLLNPDKIKMTESKQVIGPIIWSRDALRETPVYNPIEGFKVVTSLKAPLRPKSSMFSVFQSTYEEKKELKRINFEGTEFEITLGGIRIGKLLPFTAYPVILNRFEIISNRGATYQDTTDGKEVEETDSEDGFRRIFFATYVEDRKTVNELRESLIKQLVKCFSETDNHDTWDVCHPKLYDYYKSSKFRLKCKNESYKKEFENRLSFDELREEVAEISGLHSARQTQQAQQSLESALNEVLPNIMLGFRFHDKWVFAPILDCLMGQLDVNYNGEAKTYYKLSKSWYEVDQHLLKTVDREFQRCMKGCMLFDSKEGFLPDPWKTLKPTLKEISTQLKISPDDTRVLCKSTFSYVNESDGNKVMCSVLAGEILRNPNVQKHTRDIEELLTKSTLKREDLNEILKQGDESCGDSIWNELVKKREVGKIFTGKPERVLIMNPFYPNGTVEQKKKMVEFSNISIWTKSEGEYNEGYLFTHRRQTKGAQPKPYTLDDKSGYLLGDRICPQGIELFDILYFTETKTYLYHVKDGFDQDTRVACSQIRNSAVQLRNTIQNEFPILDQFYKIAVHEESKSDSDSDPNDEQNSKLKTEPKLSEYRRLVKQQMEAFGKDNFMKLFKRDKVNIVFVYAFLDSRTRDYCELTQDMVNKEAFSPGDFAIRDPKDTEQCLFAPGQSWEQRSEMLGNAMKIFKELVVKEYLDDNGYRNIMFFKTSSAKEFKLTKDLLRYEKKVWEILEGGLGSFHSLIARFEVLSTRAAIQNMGFTFKICQIKQPCKQTGSSSSRPTTEGDKNETTSLVYHRQEGGKSTITGFPLPADATVPKSYGAFQALFGESCKTEHDVKQRRESFVELLKEYLNKKDRLVLKLLEDNTKYLVLEAAWREKDSSTLSKDIKLKESFLLCNHTDDTKTTVDGLRTAARQLKEPSNKVLEQLFKNTLCCCGKTASGIDDKGKVSVMDLLKKHYTWFIELISPLLKGENLQGEFRKLQEALNLVDQRINELFEVQSFSSRILGYFQQEQPFTPYEFELLAYLNEKPVEIIREGICCSDEYECINSRVLPFSQFHSSKKNDN